MRSHQSVKFCITLCYLKRAMKQYKDYAFQALVNESISLFQEESTEVLDTRIIYRMSHNILNLSKMTRIVVTHTLEETQMIRYDEIIVLKNAEKGSFDEN